MKVSFSWLQSYFPRPLEPEKVAHMLTRLGLEVEAIEKPQTFGKTFVVGKVLKSEKHPNADRLKVCEVQISKKEKRTVVCGAPNVAAGQTVAVVLPGSVLPNGQKIEEAEIRGQKSSGMICAEDELGLGDNHEGILVLDESLKVGTKLDKANLQDTILDFEVTPNRPDWLSVYGVAREVAVATRQKLAPIKTTVKESAPPLSRTRSVQVQKGAAIQYHLREVYGFSDVTTPDWMASRLQSLGVSSDTILVDVTNYVLYELGQPLHAFDADKIKGKQIRARFAKAKERIILLDGKTYPLVPEDIVIADASGPIALAGIMGGQSTAVTKDTKRILIESAIFPSKNIRHTSRRLGLRTDAASRFEKGVTPDLPKRALAHAVHFLQVNGQAKVSRGQVSYAQRTSPQKPLTVSLKRMNTLLGTRIPMAQAKQILSRLSFIVKSKGPDSLVVAPPAFRVDVFGEADVAEELARVYGYDRLRKTMPQVRMRPSNTDDMLCIIAEMKSALVQLGYTELLLPSFYGEEKLLHATLPKEEHRTIANPLDSQQHYLRSDVLPGMIEVVNLARKSTPTVKVFEIGQVFWKNMKPPAHEWRIGLCVSIQDGGEFIEIQQDFARVMSLVLHRPSRDIHIGKGAHLRDIKVDTTPVGLLALRPLKKGMTVACIECSVAELLALRKPQTYVPSSKFPSVNRDISVVVPANIDTFTIERQLYASSALLESAELFDVHPQSDATVSYAYHLHFSHRERTLASHEVDMEMLSIERALQQKGGIVRT